MLAKALASATAAAPKTYVEDVFSTWLYTGNSSTQTITNGIDLSGEGGLVWFKQRNDGSSHELVDTARGAGYGLDTRVTNAQTTSTDLTSFGSTGFSLGYNTGNANYNTGTFASWTFRKAAKFFDVVTYTGNGSNRTIAHNLGSVPGCIIVKRTDTTGDWQVYHRANTAAPETDYLVLNSTAATADSDTRWNDTLPTSTVFSLGTDATVNASGGTYVAYLFAHDAGGFGDAGDQSVIKCGSFNDPGTGVTVDLGWEPQWVLLKRTSSTGGNWRIIDNMRGWPMYSQASRQLFPNTAGAEDSSEAWGNPTPTGFFVNAAATGDYIYIAIRRGPMKTPTDATKVFAADAGTNGTSGGIVTTGFPVDMDMTAYRSLGGVANVEDRVRGYGNTNTAGATRGLLTSSTAAETTGSNPYFYNAWNTTITRGSNGANPGGDGIISWFFRRAPGFFDVVAYTGTGASSQSVSHNLGAVPEMIIVKARNSTIADPNWGTYHQALGNTKAIRLNQDISALTGSQYWNDTSPTSTVFTVGDANAFNRSGDTLIAYLFATCPGVSKVGSYTGTGTTKQIDCGFTSGARFVLIKRTDSTGDWYVYDTARGIVSGNDPYLLLNSTAAEVTGTDYIDPLNSGFEISSTAPAAINANGGSFIFLAIA